MTEDNNNSPEESNNSPSQKPKPNPFKGLVIRVLRGIINRLETIVQRLETEPVTEEDTSTQPPVEELRGWDKILRQLRDRAPITRSLPDGLLTTILVGGSVAIVWGTVALIPDNLFQESPPSSSETEISQQPEQPKSPIPPPEETVESPPEITVTSEPQSNPEPQPEPELPPEQGLIAAIQEQVSEITTRYAEGLIESIEANFRDGRLIIAVNEEWFNLSASRQDELSKEMLARSRKLDFTKLVLTTPDGKLLARSPVVGEEMVILQRKTPSPEQEATERELS